MTSPAPAQGRLERTRARIAAVALELFSRNGYDGTTVAQIAAAAGVTEMTFYRHFGSKAQLLIDDPYDPLIAEAIGRQPVELPPLLRTVRGIRETWRALPITEEAPIRERIALVAQSPSLNPAIRASTAATEIAIAEQLTQDGADPDEAAIAGSGRHGRHDHRAHPVGPARGRQHADRGRASGAERPGGSAMTADALRLQAVTRHYAGGAGCPTSICPSPAARSTRWSD